MKTLPENEALWKDEKGKQEGGGFGGNGGGYNNRRPSGPSNRGPRRN